MKPRVLFAVLAALIASSARAESPRVVASIRPLHALTAAVMEGVGAPALLVESAASPHGYQLKPSQRSLLENADLIFYLDDHFETFLAPTLEALPETAQPVALAETIPLLPLRNSGVWETHEHDDEDEHHGGMDYHLWLDPQLAAELVGEMETALAERYPAHAEQFHTNAAKVKKQLTLLDDDLAKLLAGVKEKPFIVFHDSLQYFEKRYGLHGVGSLTLHPEMPPSAARLREIREKIRSGGAVCVFSEPPFSPRLTEAAVEDTGAKQGMVDVLGYAIPPGGDQYDAMMRALAGAMKECLMLPVLGTVPSDH